MENNFNSSQMPPMSAVPQKKSVGPVIAVIVILGLIIIGGLYFLNARVSEPVYEPAQSDAMTDSLRAQGASDDLNSIEADLRATNIDNLDQGAAVIEAELQ